MQRLLLLAVVGFAAQLVDGSLGMGFGVISASLWLAVVEVLILFTLALTWVAIIAGLTAKAVDGASAFFSAPGYAMGPGSRSPTR